jgi:shikimate 5-dehydrogenase
MSDRYAVIGNPIGFSKSPLIHGTFARMTGQDLVYEAIEGPIDGFSRRVDQFRRPPLSSSMPSLMQMSFQRAPDGQVPQTA